MAVQTAAVAPQNLSFTRNMRVWAGSFASIADADTFPVPNMQTIISAVVSSGDKTKTLGCTFATNIVTFANSGAAVAGTLMVVGV